jgi:small-conductance mechanosensitive channel
MPELQDWIDFGVPVIVALGVALAIIIVVSLVARVAARRNDWARALASDVRHPFRLLLTVSALWVAVTLHPFPYEEWKSAIRHTFLIVDIAIAAWLVTTLLGFGLDSAMRRYRVDVPDNRVARRMQTQLAIVRRLSMVIIWLIALSSILLTFDGVQAVGASLLASAGVASIVAGLAAQSTLANVIAGLQLAFTDAIRVDDVVVVEEEWGKIEEITLTYVVVHIWDDRRLVLPSTYFTTTPFENWTRRSSELLGSVEFDLDWRVSPAEMREKLDEVLLETPLYDGRAHVLQVTEATGGYVRIRILVTARDAPSLFDLRCFVREQMVEWLHSKDAGALPVTRVQMVQEQEHRVRHTPSRGADGLFTGSLEAQERASTFTSAIPLPADGSTGDLAPGETGPDIRGRGDGDA